MAWPISERFGRKPALLLGTIPGLAGWIGLSVSNLLPTREGFLAFFYGGRILTGFSAGWTIFCVSVGFNPILVTTEHSLLCVHVLVRPVSVRSREACK